MIVTIIPKEGVAIVDGVFHRVSMAGLPDNLLTVNWYGSAGIELWTNAEESSFSDIAKYQEIIDRWQEADDKASDPYYGLNNDEIKEKKKGEIAAQRFQMETAGVEYNGMTILTDRESAQILDSAIEKIRRGLVQAIAWKCPNGYLTLTADNIDAIEMAVLTHVQAAFMWEKSEVDKLN